MPHLQVRNVPAFSRLRSGTSDRLRGSIITAPLRMGSRSTTSPLRLLDLRGGGGRAVGAEDALAKNGDRRTSQAWSQYFYEHPEHYRSKALTRCSIIS
ncbi:MAG: hypothetical protein ACR2PL_12645 [Dehalococcoidia bacterium]